MEDFNSKYTGEEVEELLDNVPKKQDSLVSGTNIKTINNQSILGSGDIQISGGTSLVNDYTTGTDKAYTTDYVNKLLSSLETETKIGYVLDNRMNSSTIELLPLYKKTIRKQTSLNTGYTNFNHGISNINHVHKWEGTSLTNYQLPYYSSSGKITTVAYVDRTQVHMYAGESWGSAYNWIIDIYYTKLTD